MLKLIFVTHADQEYQAPPFYQGLVGYSPGFDGEDTEKPPPEGEEGVRFARKYKRLRKINIMGLSVRV